MKPSTPRPPTPAGAEARERPTFAEALASLDADSRVAIFAALAAMAWDNHAPQDHLTTAQMVAASRMCRWLNDPRNLGEARP